jgi:multidrug transporter EmrE-like cation transporter
VNQVIFSIFIATTLSLIGVIGDMFIKLSGSKKTIDVKFLVLGIIIYASTAFGWFYVMKHIKLSTLGVVYAISTIIFLTLVSIFCFNERINYFEIIGIMLAIVSIIILARFA